MKKIKWTVLIYVSVFVMCIASGCTYEKGSSSDIEKAAKENISETDYYISDKQIDIYGIEGLETVNFVKEMGIGINLGNTFESCGDWIEGNSVRDFETAWGSPEITSELIEGYKKEGFSSLRIPVAWSNMMSKDYTIDKHYIERVKEVTQWALESGLYVVINIHWDGGWFENFPKDKENCMEKYVSIWTQICDNFGEYGDRLMFESLNEEAGWKSLWDRYSGNDTQKEESYSLVNEINQTFVDTVRKSGGNNSERHLLIAGYNTDIECTCDKLFKMPYDPAGKCAVSVHYYTPSEYCILDEDAEWGKTKSTWGSPRDLNELEKNMNMIYNTYVDKGIPVIIGEYGAATGNKDPENVKLFLSSVSKEARKRGICPILWDTTGDGFYDRNIFKMTDKFSDLVKLMLED